MAALGIGQFGVLIALLNYGLQHIGAAQAALIFSLFPLLTLLLSAALGRERVTASLVLGVLISIAGVALALSPKLGQPQSGHWWGELAVAAAACIGALCSVLYRPYLQRYPTVPVSAFAMRRRCCSLRWWRWASIGRRASALSASRPGRQWASSACPARRLFLVALCAQARIADARDRVPCAQSRHGRAAGLGIARRGAASRGAGRIGADRRRPVARDAAGHYPSACSVTHRHAIIDAMSSSPEALAASAIEQRPQPNSLADLFFSFTFLALQGFGGVLAVVQREMVEKKRWMTREEFVEEWAVAQIMPGPNVVNLSLMLGGRYFGLRGAMAALAGMLDRSAAGGAVPGAGLRAVRRQPARGGRAARHGRGRRRPDHGHRHEAGPAR